MDDRVREIRERLAAVEREEDARVLYACESGSRAWGFASADSDYDVRFLYVRRPEWYLSVDAGRDVVERAVAGLFDVSGWDLRKALGLFRRSNPALLEWLGSPIVYCERGTVARRLRALATTMHSPRICAHHYFSMARRNHRSYLRDGEVWTKKYFHVLRPLLAVRWIESGRGVVPMEFGRLLDACSPSQGFRAAVQDLLQRKRASAELHRGPRVPVLHEFIEAELARLGTWVPALPRIARSADPLDALFRRAVEEAWAE